MDKLVNDMKSNGDKITKKEVMEKIMHTLTSKFDYVVTTIEISKDLDKMILHDLQASYIMYHQKSLSLYPFHHRVLPRT